MRSGCWSSPPPNETGVFESLFSCKRKQKCEKMDYVNGDPIMNIDLMDGRKGCVPQDLRYVIFSPMGDLPSPPLPWDDDDDDGATEDKRLSQLLQSCVCGWGRSGGGLFLISLFYLCPERRTCAHVSVCVYEWVNIFPSLINYDSWASFRSDLSFSLLFISSTLFFLVAHPFCKSCLLVPGC